MPRALPRPLASASEIDALLSRQRFDEETTLGDLLLWKIEDVEIAPTELESLLKRRGIEAWMPVSIRAKTAARKALVRVRRMLEEGDLKVLLRRVRENEEEVRYALVDETADRDVATLDYALRNQVVFHKESGVLEFTRSTVPEIEEAYEYFKTVYTQREVAALIENLVSRYGGIPMRDGSGMWFLPVAVKHIVDALSAFVNEDLKGSGGRGFLRVLPLVNNQQARSEIQGVFTQDIEWELEEARDALEKVLGAETLHPSAAKRALDRYKEAEGKARMYQSLLSVNLEDLDARMRAGRHALERLLGSQEEEEAGMALAGVAE